MPFPLRDIRKKSSQHVRACAAGDGAIFSKNRKIVLYHGADPNTRNGARLRSPSPIMAPGLTMYSAGLKDSSQDACVLNTSHDLRLNTVSVQVIPDAIGKFLLSLYLPSGIRCLEPIDDSNQKPFFLVLFH